VLVLGINSLWKVSSMASTATQKSASTDHAAGHQGRERAIDKALASKKNACAVRNERGRRMLASVIFPLPSQASHLRG